MPEPRRCMACGYDLTGLAAAGDGMLACPECGARRLAIGGDERFRGPAELARVWTAAWVVVAVAHALWMYASFNVFDSIARAVSLLVGPALAAVFALVIGFPVWLISGTEVRRRVRAGADPAMRDWHRGQVITFALGAVLGGAALAFLLALLTS